MTPKIGVQLIFGSNQEPFLEAALNSVSWANYVCAVNTNPDDGIAAQNEATVRKCVRRDCLRLERLRMGTFDFAKARNVALSQANLGDYVLIVDADDVHRPIFEQIANQTATFGHDMASAHFWHHCVYKDLWHSMPHREILFFNIDGVYFVNTMGTVHEELVHPRKNPKLMDYTYHHYGYIKPSHQVARRWEFYRSLGAVIHDYDVDQPDRAMDPWLEICHPYIGEHPPAVREVLETYPASPAPSPPVGKARVGLVMLTWDDAEELQGCLRSLAFTSEPFDLCVVDNGSSDGSKELPLELDGHGVKVLTRPIGLSLAEALNLGFKEFMDREDPPEYIGWIHPDHTFEWPNWLSELVWAMDKHPEYSKLGASEAGNQTPEPRSGNTQCYIIRRSALEKAGLFNERFQACGGYEDWEHNARLLNEGKVMIWPTSLVRHKGMTTRSRHDNTEAGRENADVYHELVGQWEPLV